MSDRDETIPLYDEACEGPSGKDCLLRNQRSDMTTEALRTPLAISTDVYSAFVIDVNRHT